MHQTQTHPCDAGPGASPADDEPGPRLRWTSRRGRRNRAREARCGGARGACARMPDVRVRDIGFGFGDTTRVACGGSRGAAVSNEEAEGAPPRHAAPLELGALMPSCAATAARVRRYQSRRFPLRAPWTARRSLLSTEGRARQRFPSGARAKVPGGGAPRSRPFPSPYSKARLGRCGSTRWMRNPFAESFRRAPCFAGSAPPESSCRACSKTRKSPATQKTSASSRAPWW
mmetsp:Transcript_39929/g.124904  ORF Transcript_39929/g.124904 Transcript_39929/m.124904 type:complete len:230 (-) Transcript_39929:1770-2459(-)